MSLHLSIHFGGWSSSIGRRSRVKTLPVKGSFGARPQASSLLLYWSRVDLSTIWPDGSTIGILARSKVNASTITLEGAAAGSWAGVDVDEGVPAALLSFSIPSCECDARAIAAAAPGEVSSLVLRWAAAATRRSTSFRSMRETGAPRILRLDRPGAHDPFVRKILISISVTHLVKRLGNSCWPLQPR